MKRLEKLIQNRLRVSVTLQIMHCDLLYRIDKNPAQTQVAIEEYSQRSTKYIRLLQLYTEAIEELENQIYMESVRDEISEMVVQCGLC